MKWSAGCLNKDLLRNNKTMSDRLFPLLMAQEYWMNTQLSIARYYGGAILGGIEYRIINKEGKDLYECSIEAEKEGRKYAIDPDESADLVVKTLIPAYKKLGRDRIIELLKQNKSEEEINEIAKSV